MTNTPCWYRDCTVTIPPRREFAPLMSGDYVEYLVPDRDAMLAHLIEFHPPKNRPVNPFRRVYV